MGQLSEDRKSDLLAVEVLDPLPRFVMRYREWGRLTLVDPPSLLSLLLVARLPLARLFARGEQFCRLNSLLLSSSSCFLTP